MKFLVTSLTLLSCGLLVAQQPDEKDASANRGKQEKPAEPSDAGAIPVTNFPKDGPPPGAPAPGDAAAAPPLAAPGDATTPPAPADSAAPPALEQGDAIPQTYRSDRYATTWEKNPFLIKVAATVQATASFAEDWELKYLSERNGVVKAGIQNRKTQEFRNVTSTPDSEGFQLVKATISRSRKESVAEIGKGTETATFKYSDTAPPPSAAMGGGIAQRQPGTPGGAVRPGMPNAPANAYRTNTGAPQAPGAATNMNQRAMPPGMQPGMAPNGNMQVPNAPPSAINRRRVLIPSPVPPTAPVP